MRESGSPHGANPCDTHSKATRGLWVNRDERSAPGRQIRPLRVGHAPQPPKPAPFRHACPHK